MQQLNQGQIPVVEPNLTAYDRACQPPTRPYSYNVGAQHKLPFEPLPDVS